MSGYYLGVDIGGTKSHALIADQNGNAIGFGTHGPGNHEEVGYEGLRIALQTVTEKALLMAGISKEQIISAGFGVAGYDWPSELQPTLDAIHSTGLSCPVEAVNDTIIGLLAGTSRGWGVAVVAGTGTNCWGWDEDHNIGRVTGVGYGEHGGAGNLVERALVAIAYEWTQRGPKTRLTEEFLRITGAKDIPSLIEGLEMGSYNLHSDYAPVVHTVACQGDPVALSIIRWAGDELGQTTLAVIRQLGIQQKEFEIVLVGSLFDIGEMLIAPMRDVITKEAPYAKLVRLSAPPVVGGVLLAMQLDGSNPATLREPLIESTCRLLAQQNA
ncbi:MAG TPA: BadF/BadG/BcrA/BcrD ATPase family protein [Anaerolineales bacterium]|nr:BadF/BadG/BcrA/BcrD ATPase family protein [Anaerolineales bacterium]